MKVQDILEIEKLRQECKTIHYFGLGFIQLKLGLSDRLHFYTPELPPIVSEEDVHNHRYDFGSQIIKGTFEQKIYQVVPGETHLLEEESCKEGVESNGPALLVGLRLESEHVYKTGCEYVIRHNVFHTVSAVDCITWVHRSDYRKDVAEVVRKVGYTKVCPFSQKVEETRLWEIVERMLRK